MASTASFRFPKNGTFGCFNQFGRILLETQQFDGKMEFESSQTLYIYHGPPFYHLGKEGVSAFL